MREGSMAAGRTEKTLLGRLRHEDSGADMIEYVLIASLIALGAIAAMQGVGSKIGSYYSSIASSM